MKNKLFENIKFGDVFVTRDGRQATFVGLFIDDEQKIWRKIVIANESEIRYYNNSGKSGLLTKCDGDFPNDLVSKFQTPVDEKKLDLEATEYAKSIIDISMLEKNDIEPILDSVKKDYKAGYRSAKSISDSLEAHAISLEHLQICNVNKTDKNYLHRYDVKYLLENQKKEIIEKSCQWLDKQIHDSVIVDTGGGSWDEHLKSEFIDDFKRAIDND